MKYTPGMYLFVADTFSRNFNIEEVGNEIVELNQMIHIINVSHEKLKILKVQLENDGELRELRKTIIEGWPKSKKLLNEKIKLYWKLKEDFIFIGQE